MSGDQLDLDAIEDHAHKTADQGAGSDPHLVIALVAEVRRLREERDAYKKAKAENDERFQLDAAAWREGAAKWRTSFEELRDSLTEEHGYTPVDESGASWKMRSLEQALQDAENAPIGDTYSDGAPRPGIVTIEHGMRYVSAWRKVGEVEPRPPDMG